MPYPFIQDTFGATGYLSKGKADYAPRPPQIQLAEAIAYCFEKGEPAFLEGPCGTGKSFAYLVNAIHYAVVNSSRVIIATATNSLLDQLATGPDCDLATLQKALPWKFRYASLKGRNNYACAQKWDAFEPDLLADKQSIRRLKVWAEETETGDKNGCPSDAQKYWSQISVSPEECSKPNCDYMDNCFAEMAKKNAAAAHVVVTNHSLLALELRHGPFVLPSFERLIVDEAHEFPDVIRKTYGDRLSRHDLAKIWSFASKLESASRIEKGTTKLAQECTTKLFDQAKTVMKNPIDTLLGIQVAEGTKMNLASPLPFDIKALKGAMDSVQSACKAMLSEDANTDTQPTKDQKKDSNNVRKTLRWVDRYSRYLDMISSEDKGTAIWLEADSRGEAVLCAQPVEIAHLLKEKLYKDHCGVAMLSATLSTNGTFDFFKREMGAPPTITTLAVDSPFDFQIQSLLLVPKTLPSPKTNEREWEVAVRETLLKTVQACDGRTLGLFTSKKRAIEAAAYLRNHDRTRTILVQGEAPPQQLALAFKRDHRSVLIGTRTFWTGLDVPGDSLQAVVIDRCPVPSAEPLLDAMKARMGGAYFNSYLFPKGALLFKQGVGRGVRTVNDVCVIVVCDTRLVTEGWGKIFLKSLPDMARSEKIEDIKPFLDYARATLSARALAKQTYSMSISSVTEQVKELSA